MKKTFRQMALEAMAAGLAFVACDDDNKDNPGGGGGTETAEWVDLGLPSGLLWAKCNLGATKPEEYGDYYAWGETSTKEVYTWETYKYCTAVDEDGWIKTLSKYNTDSEYGTPDHLTTLQPSDDVATQKLGDGARMPTETEWCELLANTTSEWTTVNGVYGCRLTASNGKSLFFPAAGGRYGSELLRAGEIGVYRSSSLYAGGPLYAWDFDGYVNDGYREYGYSVRAVCASQN
jgi:hypothetical protein